MGTSGQSKGSSSNSPLLPTWLEDDAETGPIPGGASDDSNNDAAPGNAPQEQSGNQDERPKPAIQPPPEPGRFRQARGNFSRFVGSGGSDTGSLRRAVRDYVRSGTGGGATAALRMGASRSTARNVLGVFRGIQREGIQEILRSLNLERLAGGSTQDVFIGLTEVICLEGGSIDEATARDAWLETVAELDHLGIDDLDALTGDQIREVFLTFIANSIETRLYQEIGVNGFQVAESLRNIERIEAQFKSYIAGRVRDSFTADLSQISAMSDPEIKEIVDRTYQEAWELLELLGDQEE